MNRRAKDFQPEGFPAAWKRWKADVKARNWEALTHSTINLPVELFRYIGVPKLGKVLFLFLLLIGLVALLHYSVI